MIHPLHEAFARLLIGYSAAVRPGEVVSLNLETPAEPMARALVREVLRAGAQPLLHLSYPERLEDLLELASDEILTRTPEIELRELERVDAWIRLRAPRNTRALTGADKARLARHQASLQPLMAYRIEHTRWVASLFPTAAGAQEAGMSLDAYERFVYGSMFLFDPDPASRWRELTAYQERLIRRLREADAVQITAPGTDLRLRVGGRTWINSDGRHNMPSGEVFTGPIEDSAEGVITFTVPSVVAGVPVEGVRLRFRQGQVVEASAERGGDLLEARLATDDDARYLGELGIGTNPNIQTPTGEILFDEKIAGTIHLALGRSYAQTGGRNDSAIHWDLICDLRKGGAIYLDGELFAENGRFVLEP